MNREVIRLQEESDRIWEKIYDLIPQGKNNIGLCRLINNLINNEIEIEKYYNQ